MWFSLRFSLTPAAQKDGHFQRKTHPLGFVDEFTCEFRGPCGTWSLRMSLCSSEESSNLKSLFVWVLHRARPSLKRDPVLFGQGHWAVNRRQTGEVGSEANWNDSRTLQVQPNFTAPCLFGGIAVPKRPSRVHRALVERLSRAKGEWPLKVWGAKGQRGWCLARGALQRIDL